MRFIPFCSVSHHALHARVAGGGGYFHVVGDASLGAAFLINVNLTIFFLKIKT